VGDLSYAHHYTEWASMIVSLKMNDNEVIDADNRPIDFFTCGPYELIESRALFIFETLFNSYSSHRLDYLFEETFNSLMDI